MGVQSPTQRMVFYYTHWHTCGELSGPSIVVGSTWARSGSNSSGNSQQDHLAWDMSLRTRLLFHTWSRLLKKALEFSKNVQPHSAYLNKLFQVFTLKVTNRSWSLTRNLHTLLIHSHIFYSWQFKGKHQWKIFTKF